MSVFYSWQMDTPAAENKKFISTCLEEAIDKLQKEEIILRPAERQSETGDNTPEENDVEPQIQLTSDTQGIMGTPEIASVILQKIANCDVFVADVTLTGKSKLGDKQYPNPNVCAEYGYAAGKLGFDKILLVMNEAHGDAEDLPFDFRNKRFPVRYSSTKGLEKERKKLTHALTDILGQYLKDYLKEHTPSLVLDWDIVPTGSGDFGLKFGIKNNGDKPATNMAVRLFNSDSFNWRKLRPMNPYGVNYYSFEEQSDGHSVVIRIHQDRPIHAGTTDWAATYNGVVFSLRPVNVVFNEISFAYEILADSGRINASCEITTAAFAQKGRIPALGFKPDQAN